MRKLNRRTFLQKSVAVSSVAAAALSFEEKALLAQEQRAPASEQKPPAKSFPMGKIGKLSISRLICGGNLISGLAHSRDLIYVSPLLKKYFSEEKAIQTLALSEANGINTAFLRADDNTIRILKTFWKNGGKIQWIAELSITEKELDAQIKQAIDNGAAGVYPYGGVGDELVKNGKVEVLGKAVELIQKCGAVAGIAGHSIEVLKACEKAGLKPDFYMKTFNSKRYWSAGIAERHDSVWEETPQATAGFMSELERPWVAYKVLGAGAIHPREGFQYAFQNGADFICAGMFDFQIAEDAELARAAIDKQKSRERPWYG